MLENARQARGWATFEGLLFGMPQATPSCPFRQLDQLQVLQLQTDPSRT